MNGAVERDFSESYNAVMKNKALIEGWTKSQLISIEGRDDVIIKMLDTHCGIDYIAKQKTNLYGIACRVQWKVNYESFTIRFARRSGAKTEFHKRIKAIESGAFYPAWTMQIYCDNKTNCKVLAAAICPTKALFEYLTAQDSRYFDKRILTGDNFATSFFPVYWDELKRAKVSIRIF